MLPFLTENAYSDAIPWLPSNCVYIVLSAADEVRTAPDQGLKKAAALRLEQPRSFPIRKVAVQICFP